MSFDIFADFKSHSFSLWIINCSDVPVERLYTGDTNAVLAFDEFQYPTYNTDFREAVSPSTRDVDVDKRSKWCTHLLHLPIWFSIS